MRAFKFLVLIFSLAGCAGESQVFTDSMRLIFQTQSEDVTLTKALNPNFQYLRVLEQGRPALLALGYIEQEIAQAQVTNVWYSGNREVLKIRAGRIVGMVGTPTADVAIRAMGAPNWSSLLSRAVNDSLHFFRERDMVFQYRFGIKEKVSLQKIAPPPNHSLVGLDKPNLIWFEERYEPSHLPPSIFAIDASDGIAEQSRVVYSWQCLTPDICLSMQAWDLKDQAWLIAQKQIGQSKK